MNRVYYNDADLFCCRAIRGAMRAGIIAAGDVDQRSIADVDAKDLAGTTRCHFFAGLGTWDYALSLAGWPADRPVWTASCPCQPLSCAGKRGGEKDERHLWPELYRLISECRPDTILGEQTASGDGPEWLDGVSLDLEELGYAVGTCDLPAACVGSPQRRQRLWFVAHAQRERTRSGGSCIEEASGQRRSGPSIVGANDGMAHAERRGHCEENKALEAITCGQGTNDGLSNRGGDSGGVVCADGPGPQPGRQTAAGPRYGRPAESAGFWDRFAVVWCDERKHGRGWVPRRVPQSALLRMGDGSATGLDGLDPEDGFPLAVKVEGRSQMGRAIGNAIVPQVAAKFVRTFMESEGIACGTA